MTSIIEYADVQTSSIFEALTTIVRNGGVSNSVRSEHRRKLDELAARFAPQEANVE